MTANNMQTIFFVVADSDGESVFHGFYSSLGKAVKRVDDIMQKTNYAGNTDIFIEEYGIDQILPNVISNVFNPTDRPIETYNRAGVKIPKLTPASSQTDEIDA